MLALMGGPSESTIRAKEYIAATVRQWARAPIERAENRTAARLVDLWDARRKRGVEPLFAPTIGTAIRVRGSRSIVRVVTSRPRLTCAVSIGTAARRSRA